MVNPETEGVNKVDFINTETFGGDPIIFEVTGIKVEAHSKDDDSLCSINGVAVNSLFSSVRAALKELRDRT